VSNQDPQPSLRVTLVDIYATVLSIDKKVDPIPRRIDDHETRIRSVEQQMFKWLGASAAISIVISALIAFLASVIQKG
jgi:predicted component of type VI protein secretion system